MSDTRLADVPADDLRVVEVYVARDHHEAVALADEMHQAGIAARVVGDRLAGLAGSVPFANTRPRIWVAEEDASRAREIASEWESRRTKSAPAPPVSRGVKALFIFYLSLFVLQFPLMLSIRFLFGGEEGAGLIGTVAIYGTSFAAGAAMLTLMILAYRRKRSQSMDDDE